MKKEEVIAKVEKLLKLGESSNEHEASLAIERARELMTKYQIEAVELKDADSGIKVAHELVEEYVREARWEGILSHAVGNYCEIKIYTRKGRTNKTMAIGLESDIILYKNMIEYLKNTIIRLANEAYIPSRHGNKNAFRTSFANGATFRLCRRMEELKVKNETSESRALVVCKEALIDPILKTLNLRFGKPVKYVANEAFRAGEVAGESISLNRQVGGKIHEICN